MESPNESKPKTPPKTKAPQGRGAVWPRAGVGERGNTVPTLLAAARAGDQRALATLLAEARPRALSVALKVLRSPDDAEDAVQEAFLKVWRYLDRFEGRASFTTWIHRIVMNASLDLLRRQSARPELDGREEAEPEAGRPAELGHHDTPEVSLGAAQIGELVRTAVAALPVVHRQALTLREFEDCSYEEIASAAACPVGTVMSRLHHARHKLADELRTRLGADGATLCAA